MFAPLVNANGLWLLGIFSLAAAGTEALSKATPSHEASLLESQKTDALKSAERNASIKLFPASKFSARPMMRFGCRERTVKTITLAPETCLSGDYYLNLNMLIDSPPTCADGSVPEMSSYRSRGCEGVASYNTKSKGVAIPEYCLWGGHASETWSMMFHCDGSKEKMKHETAIPPVDPSAAKDEDGDKTPEPDRPRETPSDASVVTHLFPACNCRNVGGPKPPLVVPVDRCLTTHGFGLVITVPAVCSNGTRAKWARFSDDKCGHGTIDKKYGLVDVADSDVKTCLSTGFTGTREKVRSSAFWCEGVRKTDPKDDEKEPDEDRPKAKTGSISESACMPGKAPFFRHPKSDTCVNLSTDKLKIYSMAVCANGTESTLALYDAKGCPGAPREFRDVKKEDLKTCLDTSGSTSFAFYCTGKDIEAPVKEPGNDGRKGSSGGGGLQFLLVLSLICLMFLLMLILSVFAWVRKYGGTVGKLAEFFTSLFKPKDGSIAI